MKDILREVPLFRELDDGELDKVCEKASVERLGAGAELFRAGGPSDCFYVIRSGRVKIRIPADAGKEERVLYLGQGKFFGEMGVIRNTPRTADAEVNEDAELVRVSQEDFDLLMSMDEKLSKKVMAAYMGRAAELKEEAGGGGSVDQPQSLLFFSTGAGAGASFLAANMAVKIQQLTQKSVLILDMDVEGPTQHLYGGYKGAVGGIRNLFNAPQLTKDAIRGAARKLSTGVELLGGPGVPDEAAATPEIMGELLRNALKAYHHVIVDTTSGLSAITEALMKACDVNYLAVAPNLVSVSRAETLIKKLDELGVGAKTRLILNGHERGRGMTSEILEARLGKGVLGQVAFDDSRALKALEDGEPVVVQAPKARVSADLTRLARQALSIQGGEQSSGFSLWNLFG